MILFINAAFRKNSRTAALAEAYLKRFKKNDIKEINLGKEELKPLNSESLKKYNKAVSNAEYKSKMFKYAKEFAKADEIVIAAPFWNFSIPAVLHDYIELVCTQGITFDVDESGKYFTCCSAKKLTYITTAGGYIPENDHAYGYIEYIAKKFWEIPEINYIKADGLDIKENNADQILKKAFAEIKDDQKRAE